VLWNLRYGALVLSRRNFIYCIATMAHYIHEIKMFYVIYQFIILNIFLVIFLTFVLASNLSGS